MPPEDRPPPRAPVALLLFLLAALLLTAACADPEGRDLLPRVSPYHAIQHALCEPPDR